MYNSALNIDRMQTIVKYAECNKLTNSLFSMVVVDWSLSRVLLLLPHGLDQAPLSMGFSRQEYWSGLPFLFPGDLPDPGIEPGSLTLQADSLPSEPPGKPDKYPTCL